MTEVLTKRNDQPGRLTARDRRKAEILRWAPWLLFPVISVAPSLLASLVYFLSLGNAAFLVLALTLFPFALLAAIVTTIVLLGYKRAWTRRVRERLALDGITADEVEWFRSELTTNERRMLKQMDRAQPLLADAYRETLALRLNASRVIASARRDLQDVGRRLNRASYLRGAETANLLDDLRRDQARLETVKREGSIRLDEAQTRLQMIEAAANRGASWSETSYMLQRLDEGQRNVPLGLESTREHQRLLEDAERELSQHPNQ